MARVRVVIYREQSESVFEDFVCEDVDAAGYKVADRVMRSVPDDLFLEHTDELISKGEIV